MIVKCENCQTRFKIPDDKVTEKGVKVRCTKCSHTFRVKRDAEGNALIVPAAPSAAPVVKPVPENPFASFAPVTPGDDMFSKETRVAPVPTRPAKGAPVPLTAGTAPTAEADVTVRAAGPGAPAPEVTRRGPVPTREQLAVTFGMEAEALTNPAGAFGGSAGPGFQGTSASALTNPAMPFSEIDRLMGPPPPAGDQDSDPSALGESDRRGSASSAVTDPAATYGASSGGAPSPAPPLSPPPDLFGDEGLTPASAAPPRGPDRSLFDIPPPPPESAPSPLDDNQGGLGDPGQIAPGLQGAAPSLQPMLPPPRPSGRPEDARGFEDLRAPGAARRLTGLLANLAVAAALVLLLLTGGSVYLNEGKLDLSAFSAGRMAALLAQRSTASVSDVSNGLYETRTGRSVFFVRGVVHNRGGGPLNAKVRAEILDGAELVRAAEGMAGTTPTPEDVYVISGSADQARLTARLIREARPVPPGAESPFFLLFNFGDVQSPDLSRYRLRVTVSEGTMPAEAAAGPR